MERVLESTRECERAGEGTKAGEIAKRKIFLVF